MSVTMTLATDLEDGKEACIIAGWGSVSPAGWSAKELLAAINGGKPLPSVTQRRSDTAPLRRVRPVPALKQMPSWMKDARLRRSTSSTRFALHAAMEALGETWQTAIRKNEVRLGIIYCTMNGGMQYSRKFFSEVIDNPSLASPILFPETVYNAAAGHLAALLGTAEINYTLVGDNAQFLQGISLASQWIDESMVDACLIVAAEEMDWLSDEALLLFSPQAIAAEGAAAVLVSRSNEATASQGPRLPIRHITRTISYAAQTGAKRAAKQMREELFNAALPTDALLCDGQGADARTDQAEASVWEDWVGARLSPRRILGEGLAVTSGWQTVAACETLAARRHPFALVSAVGTTGQATGMRIESALQA